MADASGITNKRQFS